MNSKKKVKNKLKIRYLDLYQKEKFILVRTKPIEEKQIRYYLKQLDSFIHRNPRFKYQIFIAAERMAGYTKKQVKTMIKESMSVESLSRIEFMWEKL